MIVFAPGPTQVPPQIAPLLSEEPPYFAGKEFSSLFRQIQDRLKAIFDTKNDVLIGTGSGSLGMELSVLNFFIPGDRVVVISHGKYGDNWIKMCRRRGLDVISCRTQNGIPFDPNELDIILERNSKCGIDIDGLFITHVETTTGVLSPVDRYVSIYKKYYKSIVILDAISSLLCEKIPEVDVAISASQKALMLPPGLFFMKLSPMAYELAALIHDRPLYFDVINEHGYQCLRHQTTYTPASYMFPALLATLKQIELAGNDQIIRDARNRHQMVVFKCGFPLFGDQDSSAVVVFEHPGSDFIVSRLFDKGIVIGSGVRDQAGKVFRIATFGWWDRTSQLDKLLYVLDEIKKEMI